MLRKARADQPAGSVSLAARPDRNHLDSRGSPHLVSGAGYPFLLVLLLVGLVLAVGVAVGVGTVSVPLPDVLDVVWSHLIRQPPDTDPVTDQIVWEFRVPRVLLAAVAGAGLSVAGVCLQALVRNPLADPYLLGVSAGASLGAVLALSATTVVIASVGVAGAAFVGAMLSVLVVFGLAQQAGRVATNRLILAGVAVGYLGTAATSYVQLQANPSELRGIMFWLLGSVAGASWQDLAVPALAIAVAIGWLLTQGRGLNALTIGDDTAAGLGIDVHRLRIMLLVVASLLTATVVSVSGGIGFVGLMVPHAVRLMVGPDHRKVLPVSLLTGALFLVIVDLVSRVVDRPNELPIGIFTAAVGAPFFLWLLRKQVRRR
jgi:iron complex transport system permease protein